MSESTENISIKLYSLEEKTEKSGKSCRNSMKTFMRKMWKEKKEIRVE